MTELNIEQLKAVALAATPGPWKKSNHANSPRVFAPETDDRLGIEMQIRGNGNRDDNRKNAAFIAAANPAAVLKLIAELERLRSAQGSAEPVAYEYGNEIYWQDSNALNDHVRENGNPMYFHPAPPVSKAPIYLVNRENWRAVTKDVFDNFPPDNRCIAYLAPPAPVSAEPVQLEVWYGSMPESNGKSNFTAILRRKGASMFDTDGFTIARSEYPERVRYDADCVRYLIGEIDKKPFILDYDADKHSGYSAPPFADAKDTVGAQMANVMFNMSQMEGQAITANHCKIMDDLRKRWDAAKESGK